MPNYRTYTSVSMGVAGPLHKPTFFRHGETSLHPLQRAGVVAAASHAMQPAPMRMHSPGLGSGLYPAGRMDMTLPPVVPFTGNPMQGKFSVA